MTHTYQIEENDTKASMLPNTDASPFCNLPCLHAVKSKNSQPPTKKRTLKLLSVHTQNPQAKNLLQGYQWVAILVLGNCQATYMVKEL
jgi:hypothetical protein